MSLSERIAARQCAVVDCQNERHPDSRFCRDDMREDYMRRLVQRPDGTFDRRRVLMARDETGRLAA